MYELLHVGKGRIWKSVKRAVINTLLTYCPRARGQPRTVSVEVCARSARMP